MSSAGPARRLIPGICADPTDCKDPVISNLPAGGPVGDMVGLEVAQRREEAPRDYGGDCAEWDIRNELRPSMACQCTMVMICVIWMIQNGMTLGTLRIRSMWIDIILMPWTVWNGKFLSN